MITKKTPIPWLILTIGVGFLALTLWSVLRANNDTSSVTDRDYYSHGLRYNKTTIEKKAAESLGWKLESSVKANKVIVWLTDGNQNPVSLANGNLTLYNGKFTTLMKLPFVAEEPGFYYATLPPESHGLQNALITFERNGARISKRLLIALR